MTSVHASCSASSSSHLATRRRTFGAGVAVLFLVGLASGGIAHAQDDVATGQPPVPPSADNYVTTTTAAQRSLDVSAFSPTCIRNVPYVKYTIVPVGFTSNGPATLTFSDINGNFVGQTTVTTLSGQVVYPGAVAGPNGEGLDWPGWKIAADGVSWIPDPSDAILRDGLTIQVQVAGVTATAKVGYVAPGSGCADPPRTTPPTTTAPSQCVPGQNNDGTPGDDCTIAQTGGNSGAMLFVGAAALLAGLVFLVSARRRRVDTDTPTTG